MLTINSNISSLVAQENLNGSGSALSQAITRLSSGKRINSAADDAAGLAISTTLQTQINGLNQGVSNANDGTSVVQTASSGLGQITQSLQTIRQLAVEASNGTLSGADMQALQTDVASQISEVNRIASQTTYNGINLLNGTAGTINFQVGANVGQTLSVNLTANMSAANVGGGSPVAGTVLGSVNTSALGTAVSDAGGQITSINVVADGSGGYTFTDQNGTALASTAAAVTASFSIGTATDALSNPSAALSLGGALTAAATAAGGASATVALSTQLGSINADMTPPLVSNINISTANGASAAIEAIDNALSSVNTIQANLGAIQNRFSGAATTQQAESTDLASAQSQITDADFAQETANLSKAQVLQQAGISVLAQANSLPQQVLKLLQ
ncbi:flagellin [Paraburkholderia sp. GAS41]|uniref:flagellin n=1 Tax=Paraburkholderia sp. GAS41 TaxID=3035134 RepID=UPI003D24CE48